MSLPIILEPEAEAEFDEAFDWYEGKRPGLGDRFAEMVKEAYEKIGKTPHRYAKVLDDIRRVGLRKYPYCIYYRVTEEAIKIISVFHESRNPDIWRSRV